MEESKKKSKSVFSTTETIVLVIISLIVGLTTGSLTFKNKSCPAGVKANDEYLKEFVKNYEYIVNNYYEEVDKESLINNAIAGMMNSLDDPYSVYFNEEETDNFSITLDGSYKGIGIEISKLENGNIVIISVFKSSPAEKAGLKAGDNIISINGTDAKDMSTSEFSKMVRNSNEKEYTLKILRDNEEKEIVIKKDEVTLDSVISEIYEESGKKIGYIYISIFASNTYSQFKEKLEALEKEKIDALIIDVRSNTGGHLTTVDSMLDLFLSSGQILYQFEQNGKITPTYGKGKDNKNYEIVLLGDEVSASASEVLIAGLKENLNCKFIGKKTYGKGTVQELVTLSDGTQYKITIKKWLTPKGNWVNDTEGIVPDIEVDLDSNYFKTGDDKDDTQLMRAIQYIVSGE